MITCNCNCVYDFHHLFLSWLLAPPGSLVHLFSRILTPYVPKDSFDIPARLSLFPEERNKIDLYIKAYFGQQMDFAREQECHLTAAHSVQIPKHCQNNNIRIESRLFYVPTNRHQTFLSCCLICLTTDCQDWKILSLPSSFNRRMLIFYLECCRNVGKVSNTATNNEDLPWHTHTRKAIIFIMTC